VIDEATLRRALALTIEQRRGRLFEDARAAAVLVPVLFGGGREARVVMLLRSSALRDHAGEMGFPAARPRPTTWTWRRRRCARPKKRSRSRRGMSRLSEHWHHAR